MAGVVYLVGAGPGAPDLISLRGIRALHRADVILCDNLLPRSFLDQIGIPTRGKKIIWREEGCQAMRQPEINRILCDEAGKGHRVARLKTGDPLVFGRASEEIAALSEHGIPWVVVPGISSCTAAPASAGLLLTDRGASRSFAVSSAVCAGGIPNEQYPVADSLVLLMGVKSLESVTASLLASGWSPDTPVSIIERATLSFERNVSASLSKITEAASNAHIKPPSVVLIGKAALSLKASRQPRILFAGLEPAGFLGLGQLLHWPALTVVTNDKVQAQYPGVFSDMKRSRFDTVVFSSKPGVTLFFQAIKNEGLDARLLAGIRVVAAGMGTAQQLLEQGIRPDLVCTIDAAREIPEALTAEQMKQVLLVNSGQKEGALETALKLAGSVITPLATHILQEHPRLGEALPEHDIVYFVSPSGVHAYWNAYGKKAFEKEIQCIGPATQATLNTLGFRASIVNPYLLTAVNPGKHGLTRNNSID